MRFRWVASIGVVYAALSAGAATAQQAPAPQYIDAAAYQPATGCGAGACCVVVQIDCHKCCARHFFSKLFGLGCHKKTSCDTGCGYGPRCGHKPVHPKHECKPACQTNCQPTCQPTCQPLCKPVCKTVCQPMCQLTCQPACQSGGWSCPTCKTRFFDKSKHRGCATCQSGCASADVISPAPAPPAVAPTPAPSPAGQQYLPAATPAVAQTPPVAQIPPPQVSATPNPYGQLIQAITANQERESKAIRELIENRQVTQNLIRALQASDKTSADMFEKLLLQMRENPAGGLPPGGSGATAPAPATPLPPIPVPTTEPNVYRPMGPTSKTGPISMGRTRELDDLMKQLKAPAGATRLPGALAAAGAK